MNIKEIRSQDNDTVKKIVKLKTKKYRTQFSEFMSEGILSVEAGLSSSYELCFAVASESFYLKNKVFCTKFDELIITTDKIFDYISDAETPQGIMGIFKIPDRNLSALNEKSCFIYCDNLRDPGNMGTIIRTADAMGMGGVMFSDGCCDMYSPKVVRSAMGSIFHIDTYSSVSPDNLADMKKDGFKIVSSTLHEHSVSLYEYKVPQKVVFVIGNEAHGVSQEIISISDEFIKIPMCGFAESLNAGVAAAIIMSEAARNGRNSHV